MNLKVPLFATLSEWRDDSGGHDIDAVRRWLLGNLDIGQAANVYLERLGRVKWLVESPNRERLVEGILEPSGNRERDMAEGRRLVDRALNDIARGLDPKERLEREAERAAGTGGAE